MAVLYTFRVRLSRGFEIFFDFFRAAPGGGWCSVPGGGCPRRLWALSRRSGAFRGGCPCRFRFAPTAQYSFIPIPPTPFPSGEGGELKFTLPGAVAPGTPTAEPTRHCFRKHPRRPYIISAPGAALPSGRFAVPEGNCSPGSLSLPRPGGRGPSQAPPSHSDG